MKLSTIVPATILVLIAHGVRPAEIAPATLASAHASGMHADVPALRLDFTPEPHSLTADEWVDRTLTRLSRREKIAQMIMPWIAGGAPRPGSPVWERARRLVAEGMVGGLIVGEGDAVETAAWLNRLQRLARVPLLIAADLEWGAGTRLKGATVLPINMALGATGDPTLTYHAGRTTGVEARAAGIHLALAPVADVNTNPDNPVINTRAYGADPDNVATHVAAFIDGASSAGLLTAAKHFPGHGATGVDSHLTLPVLPVSRGRLQRIELVPFEAAIAAGVQGILSAHLAVPALTPDRPRRPASLAPAIITGLLRDDLGFHGLVITDALTMGGIDGDTDESVVAAVRAGADIVLMPEDVPTAVDALLEAVADGILSQARIDASVRRILAAKATVGLHRRRTVNLRTLIDVLGDPTHRRWAQRMANSSITLVRLAPGALPLALDRGPVRSVLSVAYASSPHRDVNDVFNRELERLGALVEPARVWDDSDDVRLDWIRSAAREADIVIFSSYSRAVPWRGELGIPPEIADLASSLAADGALVINFGNPYILRQLQRTRTYLLAWSHAPVAQKAAARAIAGRIPITGRLPIRLPPDHNIGDGIILPGATPIQVEPEPLVAPLPGPNPG